MMTQRFATVLALLVLPLATIAADHKSPRNAFDDYIAQPDSAYKWTVVRHKAGAQFSTTVIDLTSQTWRTKRDVDRPVWRHWLTIVTPNELMHDTALLMIGGGRNGREPNLDPRQESVQLALATKSVVADLGTIPNQPLVFHNDGKRRYEDDLIAYAWDQYLKTGDPTWLPRLPMVKSAVRAMDTITAFLKSNQGGGKKIGQFVIAGASKRGWTTWMTAAMDKRVVACIPIVIDVVNARPSMDHHYAAYGFWAPAIGDYVRHKIPERMDSQRYAELLKLVDPYFYRDRLTMPKFIVNATGDQFFLPDSSQFYFDDLKGPKYLRYVPNTEHSLKGSDALASISAFYSTILTKRPLPKFEWTISPTNEIVIDVADHPREVLLWRASNPETRDFRVDTIGRSYKSSILMPSTDGRYIARVAKPAKGWTAFFAELVFDSGGPNPLKFTTSVHVIPRKLPYHINDFRRTIK